ncbi:hypothetical protein [Paraglaciecola sp.]|uniref:hypothetical protein n=1 Tax=Paraglaciecola sp. TaxID=1920173 RepID=UPI00326503A2
MKCKKLVMGLILTIVPTMSLSSIVSSTKITQILSGPNYAGKVFIALSIPPNATKASCNTNSTWTYVFDPSTSIGQVTLGLVLSAHATKSNVKIEGYNNCTIHSGVENLKYFQILQN